MLERPSVSGSPRPSVTRPPGLLDEEAAGGEVPGRQLVFEVGAEHPNAHHAEIQRRGPEPPDAVDVLAEEVADGRQCGLHHRAAVVVEADADEHLVELLGLGDAAPPDR